MIILYITTLFLLLISFLKDKRKTIKAFKIALKKFHKISPAFLVMLTIVSIIIYFVPNELIVSSLGKETKYLGTLVASILGSIVALPGFIAFPLAGILKQQGVTYMVLSAFTTTLMMVGIITFPIEKKILGTKVTIIRNILSFIIALIIAFVTGIVFGEIL